MVASPDILGAGLGYIALGYPVLPLRPGSKLPLPANGLKGATLEAERLARWLRAYPSANLGILPLASVLVLDFDDPGAFFALEKAHPEFAKAPLAATGGGGFHLWLNVPENLPLAARVQVLPGVDLRGLGRAYLVAPPSTHPKTGKSYVWERPLVPPSALPACPKNLLGRLLPQAPSRPTPVPAGPAAPSAGLLAWAVRAVASAPEGQRHQTLLARARTLGGWVHAGLDEAEALEALARAGIDAGLPEAEARRTAADGLAYGQQAPLEPPSRRTLLAQARRARFGGKR